ncbi:acetyltransferase GNAT family protein [Asticcacaulis biprosthecium C19]|uniref:Acetyltransferase GNAT family protein n=1 Tax=Asticcacaulis biprosthecium C19 TaxID=715226 RepID=F4QLD3_9CAUL|nr:GNAT family N-acetyltransferase [Asticcacaulis biprosthecium]EGF92278.1 acetyltransferase GNAT family protein [Asticcacaulis biprosthecium C19]
MIMNSYASDADGPVRPENLSSGAISIETSRLSLNALRDTDLDDLMAVFCGRSSARMTHTVPHPFKREDAERLLANMMAKPYAYWAIRREDERLIGVISLTRATCGKTPDMHHFGPNLGIFVAPEHQGHGLAVEAIDALLRWVKKRKLHQIIHAAHFADNDKAAQALIQADFLYTGRRTQEASTARGGEHLALHMIRIL